MHLYKISMHLCKSFCLYLGGHIHGPIDSYSSMMEKSGARSQSGGRALAQLLEPRPMP